MDEAEFKMQELEAACKELPKLKSKMASLKKQNDAMSEELEVSIIRSLIA